MFYPLFINLKNKKILVVGGGNVGFRRALYLFKSGAIVTIISKEFNERLLRIRDKNLKLIRKEIRNINNLKINFENYFLIVIATNNRRINEKLTNKIKNRALVCRADKYSDGNVVFPAVSKIGKNVVAFTTFGKNPGLSKKVKKLLRKK